MCIGKNDICMTSKTFHRTKYGKTKHYQWKVPRSKVHLNTHIKSFHPQTSAVRYKLQNSKKGLESDRVLWTMNNKRVCLDEEYIRIAVLYERKNYKHNPRSRDESMAITASTKTWSFGIIQTCCVSSASKAIRCFGNWAATQYREDHVTFLFTS